MVVRGVLESWIDSRLWYAVSDEDREFLLDVGLLEWIEAELLDEVLSGTGLMERLESLSAVAGLLEPVRGGAGNVWRLHPLVRAYCVKRRRRDTPARYRSIHGRIASAMARRGETVTAMRHAAEAANPALVGEILTSVGGVWMYLREGSNRLVAAAQSETNGDDELETQLWLARGALLQNSCAPVGSAEFVAFFEATSRLAARPGMQPIKRAAIGYALCQLHELKAEFQLALEWEEWTRRWTGDRSSYPAMLMDYHFGQIAMAQGRRGSGA